MDGKFCVEGVLKKVLMYADICYDPVDNLKKIDFLKDWNYGKIV